MKTKYSELFAALTEPFGGDDVRSRTQAGRQFDYITARTAMNRLDDVLGPENWWDEYTENDKSVKCRLTIVLPDGKQVSKEDAGGFAGMQDEGDDSKSGYSDAFKRACVKFGIARYLYGSGMVTYGDRPAAEPEPRREPTTRPMPPQTTTPAQARDASQKTYDNFKIPKAGKSVYAWAKAMEDHYQLANAGLVGGMAEDGKKNGWGGNFMAWNQEQADHVCKNAIAYLKALDNYKQEFDNLGVSASVDANATAVSPLHALKKEILAVAADVHKRQSGDEAKTADTKYVIEQVSAVSENSAGSSGELLESLAGCKDEVWLRNILKGLKSYLEVTDPSKTTAVSDDEDIPF